MGKLTDAQKSAVNTVLADATASKQQQADQLTALYRSFGTPYDRIVFSVNGRSFRVVLAKRSGADRVGATADDGTDVDFPF